MGARRETPFDSIENAHEYVQLLCEAVDESVQDTALDLESARSERHQHALRLVRYKLTQLRGHLGASSRVLNDLRTLRRLLLDERGSPAGGRDGGTAGTR